MLSHNIYYKFVITIVIGYYVSIVYILVPSLGFRHIPTYPQICFEKSKFYKYVYMYDIVIYSYKNIEKKLCQNFF